MFDYSGHHSDFPSYPFTNEEAQHESHPTPMWGRCSRRCDPSTRRCSTATISSQVTSQIAAVRAWCDGLQVGVTRRQRELAAARPIGGTGRVPGAAWSAVVEGGTGGRGTRARVLDDRRLRGRLVGRLGVERPRRRIGGGHPPTRRARARRRRGRLPTSCSPTPNVRVSMRFARSCRDRVRDATSVERRRRCLGSRRAGSAAIARQREALAGSRERDVAHPSRTRSRCATARCGPRSVTRSARPGGETATATHRGTRSRSMPSSTR